MWSSFPKGITPRIDKGMCMRFPCLGPFRKKSLAQVGLMGQAENHHKPGAFSEVRRMLKTLEVGGPELSLEMATQAPCHGGSLLAAGQPQPGARLKVAEMGMPRLVPPWGIVNLFLIVCPSFVSLFVYRQQVIAS